MKKSYLWTNHKARLQLIRSMGNNTYNWLFLPGGPGLGSESLLPLTKILSLPGSIWHMDFPGDGSNLISNDEKYFAHWREALIEAVSAFDNVILVAHSSSGMFALSLSELKKILKGFVLMGSAPDGSWQDVFMRHVKENPIPAVDKFQSQYAKNPNNETLKKLTIAAAPNFLTSKSLRKRSFLHSLPFNAKAHLWFDQHFHPTYKAKWIPTNIPTLILTGDHDPITPIQLFKNHKSYQRKNILIREIRHASHFPWIENPRAVVKVFKEYCRLLHNA